jgi:hypothetical protein
VNLSVCSAVRRHGRWRRAKRYKPLSGPEFAALVADANLTPTFFYYLTNTTTKRFFDWVDEAPNKDRRNTPIPHNVRVLLEIFKKHPETIDTAEAVTERVTTERKPRRNPEDPLS